jgi:hypothetical protein
LRYKPWIIFNHLHLLYWPLTHLHYTQMDLNKWMEFFYKDVIQTSSDDNGSDVSSGLMIAMATLVHKHTERKMHVHEGSMRPHRQEQYQAQSRNWKFELNIGENQSKCSGRTKMCRAAGLPPTQTDKEGWTSIFCQKPDLKRTRMDIFCV